MIKFQDQRTQQIYHKKNRGKAKESKENDQMPNRNNFADHIKEIENQVFANHTFIRSVVRQNDKAPDEQVNDIKNLCCTGQMVPGFDKTFNLYDMHVTMSCYN